jgi:hypothetical protein
MISKEAAQKEMKIKFEVDAFWHESSIRTLKNQQINNDIFG